MVQRVLCFPGYGQNAQILEQKMQPIIKHCVGAVEFTFIEPPYILQPINDSNPTFNTPEERDTFGEPYATEKIRAWGIPTDEEHTRFDGVDEMVEYVRDWLAGHVREKGWTFDGVFGFSQGAGTASLIAALLEEPTRCSPFLIDGAAPHPPMKYAVLVGGAGPVDSPFTKHYLGNPKLKTPSLHVVGRVDVVVSWKRSSALIDAYENPRVEWHDGCHWIPTKPSWRELFRTYITAFEEKSKSSPVDSETSPTPKKKLPWTYYLHGRIDVPLATV